MIVFWPCGGSGGRCGKRTSDRRTKAKKLTQAPPRNSPVAPVKRKPVKPDLGWGRQRRTTREWVRRYRRNEYLQGNLPLLLDDHEAAEYLGFPVRKVRRLAEEGVLELYGDGLVFDVEILQNYLLGLAKSPEERLRIVLRRVRFEARDLEYYPDSFRLDVADEFIALWRQLAQKAP